ncbi:hypothetical protein Ga0074812_108181 [Parafrankia irregularis]|uniref:NIPSNAP protein n=1 Tax=Parafrankia irregularis TaxID=795642 RepID=A0A0S4QME0_9ACTN|nr:MULTISPECIES: hypothetical protein [Parafrankia]MBE3200155.1 hypothetical protein [Parafrankia sp. CH37]CUU56653.1 hypothetical protein Ga0074812_108181 [Parafrankia irregularis]
MFFVHEIHSLTPARAPRYESLLRELWGPALAGDDRTRLVWCVRSVPGSHTLPEIVTLTAVADGATLADLGERTRRGDLRAAAVALAAERVGITRRMLAPLRFSRYEPDLATLLAEPSEASDALYIHDFVLPRTGMQRPYEDAMEQVFLRALDVEYSDFVMWGGFETVAGGGDVPENLMITQIQNPAAGTRLLSHGNPRESIRPGSWLHDSLKLRDTWTSRLVRALPWSPTA